jgi:alpha-L-rhamnosidase
VPLTRRLEPAWLHGMAYTYVRPVAVARLEPGRWLCDLCRAVGGGIRLSATGTAGQAVEVRLGEEPPPGALSPAWLPPGCRDAAQR